MSKIFIANTKNQDLIKHLMLVAKVAKEIFLDLNIDKEEMNIEKYANYVFFAGLFHDIGKVDPEFQNWCSKKNTKKNNKQLEIFEDSQTKKKFQDLIRHNEYSWAILNSLGYENDFLDSIVSQKNIGYSVLWHHAEKFRKKPLKNIEDISSHEDYETILSNSISILNDLKTFIKKETGCDINIFKKETHNIPLPGFKLINKNMGANKYSDENFRLTLSRLCLVVADREVSSMDIDFFNSFFGDSLDTKVKNFVKNITKENMEDNLKFKDKINDYLNIFPFDDRSKIQQEAAKSSSLKKIAVLQGPAGVGKTKISLEYASLTKSNKLIYICPRVSICQGLYDDISLDIPNLKVQIYTGEYKLIKEAGIEKDIGDDEFLSGDIIITTIDQMMNLITNHGKFTLLFNLINTTIVFDEFHEIISTPSMIYYLKEILDIRKLCKARTLLMSATPNPKILNFFDIDVDEIVRMNSYHNKIYNISLEEYEDKNPLEEIEEDNSIIISNTLEVAQRAYLKKDIKGKNKSIVLHSSYVKEDKNILFNLVFDNFGKNIKNRKLNFIRSGPIIQASLNISAKNVYTELSSPEDLNQRQGRNNRFSEYNEANFKIFYNKNISNTYLKKVNFSKKTSFLFVDFLINEKGNVFRATLNDMYELYFKFYEKFIDSEELNSDFEKYLETGMDFLIEHDFFKPIEFFNKNKKIDKNKLSKVGLRGSSVYINPNVIKIRGNEIIVEKTLFNNLDIGNFKKYLTLSCDDYRLLEIIDLLRPLLKHLNHLYPENFNKYNSKKEIIISRAKNPQFAIYTSEYVADSILDFDEFNLLYLFERDKKNDRYITLGLVKQSLLNEINYKIRTEGENCERY